MREGRGRDQGEGRDDEGATRDDKGHEGFS